MTARRHIEPDERAWIDALVVKLVKFASDTGVRPVTVRVVVAEVPPTLAESVTDGRCIRLWLPWGIVRVMEG